MKQEMMIYGKTIIINDKLFKEYQHLRRELTEEHLKSLLLTVQITEQTELTEEEISSKIDEILREELEVGRQLADPNIQVKGFHMIS